MIQFLAGLVLGALAVAVFERIRRGRRAVRRPNEDERVTELSQLAGGLAHELRNPLSTLMVNLTLLAEDLGAGGGWSEQVRRRCRRRIETIRTQADRLNHLFENFLRLVGPCKLNLADADLNRTVERLIDFFGPQATSAGIRIHSAPAPGPLSCRMDERLLEQALLNILVNAQQAMPDGGELMIRTRREDTFGVVEISDTGVGMDEQTRAKVFDPFFSTKSDGTGLGLSTTKRIITEHCGRIHLHSEPGKGTSFALRLPLAARSAESQPGTKNG